MNTIFKNFDISFLKKMSSPKASGDLNAFLEKLPQNTSQTLLIITGVAWAAAGAIGLYTTIQMKTFTELRAELQELEAVKPSVPSIENKPIDSESVATFVKELKTIYTGLDIRAEGSSIVINGDSTSKFGQFRESIGHVQNGGDGWRVIIDQLCVGRECGKKNLEAKLNINKIEVKEPT